ncbi:MAG TPA: KGK domain-containing protein [Nostocaceae cyanobacterium]|nr:KGK domain-containing protein [Nostocaceae cyanobacterium]
MADKFNLIECNDDDVVEFEGKMYRIGQIRKALHKSSESSLAFKLQQNLEDENISINDSGENIFTTGVECQILNLGSTTWKKGNFKFKISIEFYVEPEEDTKSNSSENVTFSPEPESPLDDLRRMLNEEV